MHSAWRIILTHTSGCGPNPCPSSKSLANDTEMENCPPLKKSVKDQTVEDALHAVRQVHVRLGGATHAKMAVVV
jgi:hypothetical protein